MHAHASAQHPVSASHSFASDGHFFARPSRSIAGGVGTVDVVVVVVVLVVVLVVVVVVVVVVEVFVSVGLDEPQPWSPSVIHTRAKRNVAASMFMLIFV